MLPGPDQILECPSCQAPVAQPTISSGNTFGAVYYTDGYMDAPMLPQPAVLVRCPECAAPFIRRDARQLGSLDRYGMNLFPDDTVGGQQDPGPAWSRARRVAKAEVSDYASVLASGRLESDVEMALRLEYWHVGNHARRELPEHDPGPPMTDEEAANLLALAAMLDQNDLEQRVTLAEVRRELGQFDQALFALAVDFPEEVALAAARVRALVQVRKRRVAVLYGGEGWDRPEAEG